MRILDIVLQSKASSTNRKYDLYFHKFSKWCELFNFSSLPALPKTVCVFLSTLLQQKVSTVALDAYHYAINLKHQLTLLSNPCEDRIVKMTLERSKRILSVPVKKKEPMTVDILRKIVTFYSTLSLKSLSICTLCILVFSGFFRYSELSAIRMSDIKYSDSHVEINLSPAKQTSIDKVSL